MCTSAHLRSKKSISEHWRVFVQSPVVVVSSVLRAGASDDSMTTPSVLILWDAGESTPCTRTRSILTPWACSSSSDMEREGCTGYASQAGIALISFQCSATPLSLYP